MFFSKRLLTLMLFCLYSLLAIIEYIPYHIYLLTGALSANVVHLVLAGIIDFLLPAALATVMLVRWCERKTGKVLLECLIVSLSRIFFYAPNFYMELFSGGLDTADAIPLALLFALLAAIAFGVYSLLLFYLARLVHRGKAKRSAERLSAKKSLRAMLLEGGSFDFSHRGVGILFSVSLASFIVSLPIVNAVSYFVSYRDSIRMDEIFSIIFEVLFLLGMMVLTQLVITKFAAALLREEK